MEGKKLDIHNHILPKNWPDLKERFLSLFKNVQKQIIDKETDDRYGYGGWVSLDHSCGGCPQPGYANMMKVSANISFIHRLILVTVFSSRMGTSFGKWRKTVGAQKYECYCSIPIAL